MQTSELTLAIEKAFLNVSSPSTTLKQYKLTDEKGMSCTITHDEWILAGTEGRNRRWLDIGDEEIENIGCQLAHMQAPDFQYYLPAYMHYSVRNYSGGYKSMEILGSTVFSLSPSSKHVELKKYNLKQYSLLTSDQKLVVAMFVKFIAGNADEFEREHAKKAYDTFWVQQL